MTSTTPLGCLSMYDLEGKWARGVETFFGFIHDLRCFSVWLISAWVSPISVSYDSNGLLPRSVIRAFESLSSQALMTALSFFSVLTLVG